MVTISCPRGQIMIKDEELAELLDAIANEHFDDRSQLEDPVARMKIEKASASASEAIVRFAAHDVQSALIAATFALKRSGEPELAEFLEALRLDLIPKEEE